MSIAYPLMDLILLGLVARLARMVADARKSFVLLGAAVLLLLIADTGFTLQGYGSQYSVGSGLDALWLAAYALFGAALLHPSLSSGRVSIAGAGIRGVAGAESPRSFTAFQALRLRAVLGWTGVLALGLGAGALLIGVAWRSPETLFLGGIYGTTGSLMAIAGTVRVIS